MLKQIKLLTNISLCNTFRLNEIRHCNDEKKKRRFIAMMCIWIMLIVMFIGYASGLSYALCKAGVSDILPQLLIMIIGTMALFFTLFKAGSIIFAQKDYELQMSLPVSKTAIVISRFLSMYVTNILISLIVILPSMVVYTCMEKTEIYFWVYGLIGICFVPLLPMAIATILGAVITGISSRCKHKSAINTLLTLILAIVLLVGSMSISTTLETSDDVLEMIKNMGVIMKDSIAKIYPPAIWLGNAMIDNNFGYFALFIGVSIIVFILMVFILERYYSAICTMINSFNNKSKFEMTSITSSSVTKSLVKRELKHYFSCSIYVTNTIIGNILSVILPIALLIVGTSAVEKQLGIDGIVVRALPILLGMMPIIMPMTASSISLEGKQLWIIKSLPIESKNIILSKVLANIIVAAPFYVISEIFAFIAVGPSIIEAVWLVIVPLVYIVFGITMGIFINLKTPNFNWENETQVVKQGTSTFLILVTAGISGIVPIGCSITLQNISTDIIFLATTIVLALVILLITNKLKKIDFLKLI